MPANVPAEIFDACMVMSLKAHQVLVSRHIRTDFRWDESKAAGLILLRPTHSPYDPNKPQPRAGAGRRYSFPELCKGWWRMHHATDNCDASQLLSSGPQT